MKRRRRTKRKKKTTPSSSNEIRKERKTEVKREREKIGNQNTFGGDKKIDRQTIFDTCNIHSKLLFSSKYRNDIHQWTILLVIVCPVIYLSNLSVVNSFTTTILTKYSFLSLSLLALSLVLPTRRHWCAFNESTQTLEFYQSERDLINKKSPIESLFVHRAAITVSTTDERALIVLYVNTFEL